MFDRGNIFSTEDDSVDRDFVTVDTDYRLQRAPTLTELNLEEFVHDDFESTIAHYKRITEK